MNVPSSVLAMTILLAHGALASGPEPVYRESTASSWSESAVVAAPGSEQIFHGPFQAQPVSLKLSRLPDHRWVKLRFTLYIIGSWDGSSRVWGPDAWSLQVRGGPRLLYATFCNMGDVINNNVQSFPDEYPWGRHKGWTGAAQKNSLGFPPEGGVTNYPVLGDGTYQLDMLFPHNGESLVLDFSGIYDDASGEKQSWGIGGVEVVALETPPPVADEELPQLWQELAKPDPVAANTALWKMIAGGERTLAFIKASVQEMSANRGVPYRVPKDMPVTTALQLHRAQRICRLIGGKDSGGIRYEIEHLIPEYALDFKNE